MHDAFIAPNRCAARIDDVKSQVVTEIDQVTAMIGADGRLLGIGSLLLQMADGTATQDINMVVPINLLPPVLDDLLSHGQVRTPPRPWLGLYAAEREGTVVVLDTDERGPAAAAGVRAGICMMPVPA